MSAHSSGVIRLTLLPHPRMKSVSDCYFQGSLADAIPPTVLASAKNFLARNLSQTIEHASEMLAFVFFNRFFVNQLTSLKR